MIFNDPVQFDRYWRVNFKLLWSLACLSIITRTYGRIEVEFMFVCREGPLKSHPVSALDGPVPFLTDGMEQAESPHTGPAWEHQSGDTVRLTPGFGFAEQGGQAHKGGLSRCWVGEKQRPRGLTREKPGVL